MRYTPAPQSRNNGLGQLLRSPEMRSTMVEFAEIAVALYRARVAKRSGQLARDIRIDTRIGGAQMDRWAATATALAPHAASHDLGTKAGPNHAAQQAAHDWAAVLQQMGSL